MSYATRVDLEDRYGSDELTQREAMLSPGSITRALDDADAEINSYVSGRYAVPLSPVPGSIVRVACAIARYHLLGDSATELARKAYEDARAFLRDVQSGRASLDGTTLVTGASGLASVEVASDPRLFSRSVR